MVRAGQMRHEVTIQQRSTAQHATTGEPLNTWTTFAIRRAAIERSPGSEVWASAQRSGRVPVVLRLRYLSGVLPGMRVLLGAKVLDIISAVDLAGLREELVITAEERVEESA